MKTFEKFKKFELKTKSKNEIQGGNPIIVGYAIVTLGGLAIGYLSSNDSSSSSDSSAGAAIGSAAVTGAVNAIKK